MNQIESDVSNGSSMYQVVIESLAEVEETDSNELSPPLYEAIDPEALERLFANDRAHGKVIFNYNSYEVSVFSDGYVSVESHGT